MKKQLALVLAGMFSVGMGAAHAVDGTINFTGEVTALTCTIDINDQTNPTLNLGTVNTTDLAQAGDTGPATNFTLNLTSCPSTVGVPSVTFSGNTDTGVTTAFKNEAVDGAAGKVAVQIYDEASAAVVPDNAMPVTLVDNGGEKEAHIPFTARMIASGAATAGSLVSHADYTISYQ